MKPFSDSENLTLDRWQELEHTDPHYLSKLLEQRSSEVMPLIHEESFKKGVPVTYRDPEYNNEIVVEYPDRRRFIINGHYDKDLKKFVVEVGREIPKKAK